MRQLHSRFLGQGPPIINSLCICLLLCIFHASQTLAQCDTQLFPDDLDMQDRIQVNMNATCNFCPGASCAIINISAALMSSCSMMSLVTDPQSTEMTSYYWSSLVPDCPNPDASTDSQGETVMINIDDVAVNGSGLGQLIICTQSEGNRFFEFCGCGIGNDTDSDNDGTQDCADICDDSPEPGMSCDDGNANTINDTVTTECECIGICPLGNVGDPCNDGNPNTVGDQVISGCLCVGISFCNLGDVGDPCDDGNPNTSNDAVTIGCECVGICSLGNAGDSCDDGNPSTLEDKVTINCTCVGQTAIPTLSEWGLICLSLLMLIIGVVAIRNRESNIATENK